MGDSEEIQKKTKKTVEAVAPADYASEDEEVAPHSRKPPRVSLVQRSKTTRALKEQGIKKKSEGGSRREGRQEGSVVITEKEYKMLMSLKKASSATDSGNNKGTIDREDDFLESNVQTQSEKRKEQFEAGKSEVVKAISEEISDDGLKRRVAKGKQPLESPLEQVSHEGVWKKTKHKKAPAADAYDEDTSDSDFQRPPKRRARSGHMERTPPLRTRKHVCRESGEAIATEYVEDWADGGWSEHEKDNEDEAVHEEEHEVRGLRARREGGLFKEHSASTSSPRSGDVQAKSLTVFPFEETVRKVEVAAVGKGMRGQSPALDDEDDDFQTPVPVSRGSGKKIQERVLSESEARAERKRRTAEREEGVRKRESAGKKPFYILVSGSGKPYGDGLMEWKAELNKLCRALDPSIRDVRQQPHHKIQMLKKRLTDNFDYSGVISDKFLLPAIGSKISARRNELMEDLRAGRPCPSGLNGDVWERLERILHSPNFQRKSKAMKYANSCRQNVGRTGLGGEIGVRDALKRRLSRSPDPEEVHEEMRRDKGYGGKKRKKKQMAISDRPTSETSESDEGGSGSRSPAAIDLHSKEVVIASGSEMKKSCGRSEKDMWTEQLEVIKRMEAEIQDLKARVAGSACEAPPEKITAAVQSITVTPPASSAEGPGAQPISILKCRRRY